MPVLRHNRTVRNVVRCSLKEDGVSALPVISIERNDSDVPGCCSVVRNGTIRSISERTYENVRESI